MSERVTNWPTNWPREIAELKAERDVLREQIQRVRELWTTCSCDRCTTNHLAILRALDGPDE